MKSHAQILVRVRASFGYVLRVCLRSSALFEFRNRVWITSKIHRHYQVVFDLSPLPLVYDIASPYKGTDIQILVQLTRGWLLHDLGRVI